MTTYEIKAKELRRDIETVLHHARGSFSGGSLSIADVMTVIFEGGFLRLNPNDPWKPDRDMLILSKGHCSSALYCSLARAGMFSKEELMTYGADGSKMIIHPKIHSFPGIESSSGSLGHGLALGSGSALAAKIKGYDSRIFVIVGDGECNEGSVWENAAFAARQKLNNLIVVIDRNKLQGCGRDSEVLNYGDMAEKWRAFGFCVYDINGHDCDAIEYVLKKAVSKEDERPTAIIAQTIKGKGVSFMEDRLEWHYKSPNDEQYALAMEELK